MDTKIALVTGATAGIGEAIALRLAADGCDLIITGRREDRLKLLAEKIKRTHAAVNVHSLHFDVRDEQQVLAAIQSLPEPWKAIDVLVNNAGLAVGLNPVQTGVIDDWERMIDTNVKGLLYMTRYIAPLMMERKKGHIINIGSIAGREVYPNGNVYCASKHAVDAITKGARMDLLPYGIKVSQIAPGAVETEFSIVRFKGDRERADNVYKGFTPLCAEDIADMVSYMLHCPPHVNIADVLILPSAQAAATITEKKP